MSKQAPSWKVLSKKIPNSVEEVIEILLSNRGVSRNKVDEFLHPKPPNDISFKEVGIKTAEVIKSINRIEEARNKGERVVIFGDYDADGICATAILWLTLTKLNVDVWPFIPHRVKHGYGLTEKAIDEVLKGSYLPSGVEVKKPSLIITVDNGIVAHEAIKRLVNQEKVDVIVTDHHQPELVGGNSKYPRALAVIHSTKLCGATVAWLLAKELDAQFAETLLDLAGVATIADQVPLIGANRGFASHGIKAIRQTKRIGLKKLFKLAKIDESKISSQTIGFNIVPKINAIGRMGHGLDALRLLCTKNEKQASELATVLDQTNDSRRSATEAQLSEAVIQAEKQLKKKLLVVASENFQGGIIGLIAGRLAEMYYKPTVAISLGTESAKGSARGVAGVNITELLRQVQNDLLDIGGHEQAAGFSVLEKNVSLITKKLQKIALQEIGDDLLEPSLAIDMKLPWSLVNYDLVKALEPLEPFGTANDQPVFLFEDLKIVKVAKIGSKKEHLRLAVADSTNTGGNNGLDEITAVGWNLAGECEDLTDSEKASIVGQVGLSEWRGKSYLQIIIKVLKR